MNNQKMQTNLLIEETIMKTLDKIHIKRTNDFIELSLPEIDEKITDI